MQDNKDIISTFFNRDELTNFHRYIIQEFTRIPTVNHQGETLYLRIRDILLIESDGRYANIYLTNGNVRFIRCSLKELRERYPYMFININRNKIINPFKIEKIIRDENGRFEVVLSDSSVHGVSRRRVKDIEEFLETCCRNSF